ncbi:hypothetical protein [Aliiglaciecola sp. NS0011-25]|uniref:hypothetical protein n=1 Tax=Aliiglaciecola sp. NS0011-25 TaxID=3127654 RepID=UPI0033411E28
MEIIISDGHQTFYKVLFKLSADIDLSNISHLNLVDELQYLVFYDTHSLSLAAKIRLWVINCFLLGWITKLEAGYLLLQS